MGNKISTQNISLLSAGVGSQGCLLTPGVSCDNKNLIEDKISKIISSEYLQDEFNEKYLDALKQIPNYQNYFIVPETACHIKDKIGKKIIKEKCVKGNQNQPIFTENDILYNILMERGGQDLSKINFEMTLETLIQNMLHIAKGIKKIHNKNLVHSDIKPANIVLFINPSGIETTKIIDLGLLKNINDNDAGESYGDNDFLPPEIHYFKTDTDIINNININDDISNPNEIYYNKIIEYSFQLYNSTLKNNISPFSIQLLNKLKNIYLSDKQITKITSPEGMGTFMSQQFEEDWLKKSDVFMLGITYLYFLNKKMYIDKENKLETQFKAEIIKENTSPSVENILYTISVERKINMQKISNTIIRSKQDFFSLYDKLKNNNNIPSISNNVIQLNNFLNFIIKYYMLDENVQDFLELEKLNNQNNITEINICQEIENILIGMLKPYEERYNIEDVCQKLENIKNKLSYIKYNWPCSINTNGGGKKSIKKKPSKKTIKKDKKGYCAVFISHRGIGKNTVYAKDIQDYKKKFTKYYVSSGDGYIACDSDLKKAKKKLQIVMEKHKRKQKKTSKNKKL